MAYRDIDAVVNVRTPSFRGVTFGLSSTEGQGGRELAIHEFVGRDLPYTEDSCRSPLKYPVEAFYVGPDYLDKRDALIKALQQPGPGELVHPSYGTLNVCVQNWRAAESATEGNIVRIQIEFVEAGSLLYPSVDTLRGGLIVTVRAIVAQRSLANFLRQFNVVSQAAYVVNAVKAKVRAVADVVSQITTVAKETSDDLTDLAVSVADLRRNVEKLIDTPDMLAEQLSSAIDLVGQSVKVKSDCFDAYKRWFSFGDDDVAATAVTDSALQKNANDKALNQFVRSNALAGAAEAAAGISFGSTEDAEAARSALFDEIDILSETIDDDDLLFALADLRVFVSKNVPDPDLALPHVIEIETAESVPALVLSYRLFGDTSAEADLIARNSIVNPNRVPGGATLRALDHV